MPKSYESDEVSQTQSNKSFNPNSSSEQSSEYNKIKKNRQQGRIQQPINNFSDFMKMFQQFSGFSQLPMSSLYIPSNNISQSNK